jgi:AmmeMemoRadiSam system protein A
MGTSLTKQEQRDVLAAARRAIADAVAGRRPAGLPAEGVFARRAGAFVSLHRRGMLRGCIGHISADQPLAQVLGDCAVAAATEDPRFPSVTAEELADVDIEVSILGGIERVDDVHTIDVGRHGLIMEHHGRRGLLLPQVATEHHWDRSTFLSQTCVKAGLAPDAWKHGATISCFDAEVFGERER